MEDALTLIEVTVQLSEATHELARSIAQPTNGPLDFMQCAKNADKIAEACRGIAMLKNQV